jgi:FlaG/FlaF family flagellin (archaellin)
MMIVKRYIPTTENAVSPVIGVMLMLVVVIIIAAVVSGFAGSLVSGEKKAPQMSAETTIANSGYYYGSYFSIVVTGVSEPIPSKDLKLVTSWIAKDGTTNTTSVLPLIGNYQYGTMTSKSIAPWGNGPGITRYGMFETKTPEQLFGNFTITSGTSIHASPMGLWDPAAVAALGGYGPDTPTYQYVDGTQFLPLSGETDGMQAVLGIDWNKLREGDIVNVKLIHVPSGKIILDQNVAVRGG